MVQKIINVVKDSLGGTYPALLNLPDDYSTGQTTYSLLIFLQGAGESGADLSKIYNSASAGGPAYYIEQNLWPTSFINPVDKKPYKFIILSPQANNGWSTTAQELDHVITSMIQNYRVDVSRIYLTGLSAGGEGILEYVGKISGAGIKLSPTHPIAAFVPMSAVMNAFYRPDYAKQIVADNVGIWGFGSASDTHGANTLSLVTWDIDTTVKAGYGISTAYTGGHCCWGQFYNPAFKQNGMSIYEWMLQFSKSAVVVPPVVIPPIIPPPVVAPKTITKVVISYSDGTSSTLP